MISGREPSCQVRVAAVGCGYWGKNLVRNFAELGALAAICDPNRPAADELGERYRIPVAEFEAVLQDDSIAAVAIGAPAVLHAELTRRWTTGKASLVRLSACEDKPWGVREFTLSDASNNCIRFCAPIPPSA